MNIQLIAVDHVMVLILVSVIAHIESSTGRIKLHESMGVDRNGVSTDGWEW